MFIPLGDDNSQRHRVPFVTLTIIALNVFAFVLELGAMGQGSLESFLTTWSVIPAAYTGRADLGGPVPWTILSAMFLHGGWAHLIGNMVYLGIFGDNVESAFGHGKYLIFYLLCGAAASLAHVFTDPASTIPSLGASGAISGVLAAYLMMFPRNRVMVWIFFQVAAVPALVVIGMWIVVQLFTGVGTLGRGGGGVAYLAHVGGFVAGLVFTFLFRPRRPQPEIAY
ncbi:MAG: rhomboid family intramembrane serine protease [Candidatus Eiseniibacteriota bacterium]